jgi:dienelactone hydrolase
MISLLLLLSLLNQDDLADRLRELDAKVLPAELPRMIGRDARARIELANQRESKAWSEIRTRADWEKYRDAKVRALRESLGADEPFPPELKVWVTRTLEGQGHRVENVLYQSKKGLLVSANLYVPTPERESMPGMIIVHSHHNPKTQGELQDMGVTWARLGCMVLIPDQLGHGERRQHPFVDASSYPGSFKPGRQDYFFRFNVAFQLQLVGESLSGWMVADLMKGVDLLLSRPGVDKNRIILLGSVAGGGDPAAVAAALDPRITAVVPFNFGGPQPETTYPLPDNAETTFNYAGSGSWESTRNLSLSARDGFLPWVIVGSVAPRRSSTATSSRGTASGIRYGSASKRSTASTTQLETSRRRTVVAASRASRRSPRTATTSAPSTARASTRRSNSGSGSRNPKRNPRSGARRPT